MNEDEFQDLIRRHRAALKVGRYIFLGWKATALVCLVPFAILCLFLFL